MNDLSLCYVAGCWAYFTSQSLEKQWGDDWNDAPYEHNAGDPYLFDEGDRESGKEPWQIVKVAFESGLETPDTWVSNSQYSVEDINRKATPWLQSGKHGTRDKEGNPIQIWAGVTMEEFMHLINQASGKVYLEFNLDD